VIFAVLGKETTLRKTASLLLSLGVIAGALFIPATAAHATFAGVAGCQANLPQWPTTSAQSASDCADGSLPTDGLAIGAGIIGGSPRGCAVWANTNPPSGGFRCKFRASISSYQETCVGPLPPALGTASGTITVTDTSDNASTSAPYSWVRVGLTAVIVPGGGNAAGVAAFVPVPPLGTCAAPLPLTAHVVGAAVAP
jgi:hypothetical protein